MKTRAAVLAVATLLAAAVPAAAASLQLSGYINQGEPWYFWPGLKVLVGWMAKDVGPGATVKVTLLRGDVPLRVLASAVPLDNLGSPSGSPGITFGHVVWTPTAAELGCGYVVRVELADGSLSAVSEPGGIYPAQYFPTKGSTSFVRLDAPAAGAVLILGGTADVRWTLIPDPARWPSQKLKLELFYGISKVGDIAEVPLDLARCPMRGSYAWRIGALAAITDHARIPDGQHLSPGNDYWIRASGDGSSYFGNRFVVALSGGRPKAGGTPVPKLPAGIGGSPKD